MTAVAAGTDYDLTTDGLGNVTINGAIWSIFTPTDATGSGVFHAFFREQARGNERGYNTDYRPLQFDELTSATFTHSVLLADVPIVEYPNGSGNFYREFQLDINEKKSDPDWYLSLDEFQVWTTNDQNLTGYNESLADGSGDGYFPDGNGIGQAKLVYNLDGAEDSWIKMDFRANPGSGKRDCKVLVPEENFTDKYLDYCVIFARHGLAGGDWISDDGFEEWGVAEYPTEPAICVEKLVDCNDDGYFWDEDMGYVGDTGHWNIIVINCGSAYFKAINVTDTNGMSWGPFSLAVGEFDEFNYDTIVNETTNNTVTVTATDVEDRTVTATDWATNLIINPNTTVNITASAEVVYKPGFVDLYISEYNNGDVPLQNPHVNVTGGAFPFALDNTTAIESMTDDDILEVGETWTWEIIPVGPIITDITFTATGHGIDPLGNDVTYPEYAGEQDSVFIDVIDPDTNVTMGANATMIYSGDVVLLTIKEINEGDVNLTNPYVNLAYDSITITLVKGDGSWVGGDTDSDGELDPSETWEWQVEVGVDADTTFNATGHGTDPLGNDVTWCLDKNSPPANTVCDQDEKVEISVYVIAPDTLVNITISAETVYVNDTVNLTITEKNNGNDPLVNPYVDVDQGIGILNKTSTSYTGGDTNGDGILDPGETWTWVVTGVVVNSDTTFTATGHGTDSLGNDVTYPEYAGEQDDVDVDTIGPDTMVNITISADTVYVNDTVNLTITEENNGNDPLVNPYVDVDQGIGILNKTSTSYTGGDTNGDGILDPGETWTWVVTGVVVSADTTFTALGHGTDSLGNDISFATGYEGEKATVDPNVIAPDTLINISASADTVYAGDTVNLTVTEENNGNDPLVNPYVDVDQGIGILNKTSTSYTGGDTNGDGILDPGETWTWVVTGVVVDSDTTFTATGHGTDSLGNDITYPDYPGEQDDVDVDTIGPDTMVNITASVDTVYAGDAVTLTVTEENNGNTNLTGAYVAVDQGIGILNKSSSSYTGGDTNGDGILDPGETWTWVVAGIVVDADTTFIATGHGTDSRGNDITYPDYAGEQDSVSIDVIAPDTLVKISSSATLVFVNDTVNLTVTEKNTGDLNLTNPYVVVTPGGYMLNKTSGYYVEGDSNDDGALNISETWKWVITGVVINADTTFTALGHGFDPSGNDTSFANGYEGEKATVDIDVTGRKVPVVTPSGLIALVSSLATIAALSIRRKRR